MIGKRICEYTWWDFASRRGRKHEDKSLHPVDLPDPERLMKEFWDIVNNPQKVSANILTSRDVTIRQIDGCHIIVIVIPRAHRDDRPVVWSMRTTMDIRDWLSFGKRIRSPFPIRAAFG